MAASARAAPRSSRRAPPQGHGAGFAIRAEPARVRHLSALHARHLVRAAVEADVRPARGRDQRRRAGQYARRRPRGLCRADEADPRSPAVGTILQSDETGVRVGKKNWWLWVFHHEDSAVFVAEPSRGKERGGGLPRRFPARLLGLRSLRRPDGLGGQGQSGLPRPSHSRRAIRHRRRRQLSSPPICASCSAAPAASAADATPSPTRPCALMPHNSTPDSMNSWRAQPAHAAGVKLQRVIKRSGGICSSSSPTAISRRPTTAPSGPCGPASCSAKSPTAFEPNGAPKLYADIRSVIETARRRAIGALDAIRLTLAGMSIPIPA